MTAYVRVAILNGSVEGEVTNTDVDANLIYRDALRQAGQDPDVMSPEEITQGCAVLANEYLWEMGRAWAATSAATTAADDAKDTYPPASDG